MDLFTAHTKPYEVVRRLMAMFEEEKVANIIREHVVDAKVNGSGKDQLTVRNILLKTDAK